MSEGDRLNFLAKLGFWVLLFLTGIGTVIAAAILDDLLPDKNLLGASTAHTLARPSSQIDLQPDSTGRLIITGSNFVSQEVVTLSYSPGSSARTQDYRTVKIISADSAGTFSQVLDIPPGIPTYGQLLARGATTGFTVPVSYQVYLTATPQPSLTPQPATTPMLVAALSPTARPAPPTIQPTPTQNPNPTDAWFAQYYPNRDLAGTPFQTHNEFPNGEWKCVCELSTDHWSQLRADFHREQFSARWTGTFTFPTTDNYQFIVRVSDGVRIIIDGVAILNDWRSSAKPRNLIQNVALTQGLHKIEIEYFNAHGKGLIQVSWRVAYPDWEARYYNTLNLSGPVIFKRNDGAPSGPLVLYADGSPAPGVNPDYFSVYWLRRIKLKHSGLYRFTGWADDGIRVFIDDNEVFRQDTSTSQASYAFEFFLPLRSGSHTIQIHYHEQSGLAQMNFDWNWVLPTPRPEPTPVL